ncbi:YolD-like family protein [Rossellomorea sp. BNER]|jgi:plasmid rolling circle replication initiator protein Rep|uniref:YolD-like family protein n=1 Tax=Rossellomorea sp. BNER TaxID=2962031 RepID=UPI003AF30F69|nr:YolD-like family protein [Rossellomorea sp. BNER]
MIRDRGRIKWTSMMLPEHVKVLRDWAKEDTYEKRMELDEQQLDEFNEILSEAMEYSKTLTITHYADHRHQLLIGNIHYFDELQQKLHIVDRFDQPHQLCLKDIADVRFS